MTDESTPKAAPQKAAAKSKEKKPWNPGGTPAERGCPECGLIPGHEFRTYDPSKPAAYQSLVFHMHGAPAVEPGPEFPKGLPAIAGNHPDAKIPPDPDAPVEE